MRIFECELKHVVLKPPRQFTDDQLFLGKWNAILNKCGFDLVALLIERSTQEQEKLLAQTKKLKAQILETQDTTSFQTQWVETQKQLDTYYDHIRGLKICKFKRDKSDYDNDLTFQKRIGKDFIYQIGSYEH